MGGFNLTTFLERNADRFPDEVAVIAGDTSLTHAQLLAQVRALAAAWRGIGVRPGDVVAILMNNSPEFLEATLSINGAGAIFLPLNTRLAPAEWSYILGHAGCETIILGPEFVANAAAIREACPSIRTVVGSGPDAAGTDGVHAFDDLAAAHADTVAAFERRDEHDVSRLMYTSGTTARPKGVPITYANTLWKISDHLVELSLTRSDRTLMTGPMYHVGSFDLPGIGTLYAGGSVVILPKFGAREVVDAIAAHRVTTVWLAPSMFNAMMQLPDLASLELGSLRLIIGGGEKMPTVLIERFKAIFPTTWLADAFGMTETVSGDTFLGPQDTLAKLGSVGKPVMHLEAKIVDLDGVECAPGGRGELLLRGPKVFNGYWRDDEATARAFQDGWFRTGDVAHFDEDGFLFIDDRLKDMIISGGENIATPEVERVLYQHEAVLEAAVVGIPDERWGQVPKAVVVLKPGAEVTAEQLVLHCREHLAGFKVPKAVEFIDVLPRTPSGKVLKRSL